MPLTTAPGVRQDPISGFRFTVEIGGLEGRLGFREVSGLEQEVTIVEIVEGNDQRAVRKLPGRVQTPNITFLRGISTNRDVLNWFEAAANEALFPSPTNQHLRTVLISLIGRDGLAAKVWNIPAAWVTKLTWSDLNAESSEIMVETMELAVERFDVS